MAELKPVYLIHGNEHVKIDAWRRRVRERAAGEGASLEVLADDRATGEDAAAALASLTLSMGSRYVVVDGVERWKDKDATAMVEALAVPAPETVVVLLGPDPAPPKKAWSPPAKLVKAVEKAGGEVIACAAPRGRELPGWIAGQGKQLGLVVDPDAARALVERIGPEQRRLQRELEKIACYAPEGGRVGADLVEDLTTSDVEAKTYQLADAMIDGDRALALSLAEDLQDRGTDIMQILYALLRQLRQMRRAWAVLETGGSTSEVQAAIGGPPWIAKQVAGRATRADGERLERIAAALADLDYAVRGGGQVDTGTALTLTLALAA